MEKKEIYPRLKNDITNHYTLINLEPKEICNFIDIKCQICPKNKWKTHKLKCTQYLEIIVKDLSQPKLHKIINRCSQNAMLTSKS